jgi:O-antigen/teichoic acid export membrane protein
MGYTKSVVTGITWVSAFRIVTRLITFVRIAILARLLSPSQFGLFGISSLVLALLEMLTETGINIFIVQSKKDIKEYINSAWVVSIIRGSVISLCILIASPLISTFFNAPDSLYLLWAISIVPVIRGFINPAVANMQKNLQFGTEFKFRTIVFTVEAVVAILSAFLTQSVYSLVIGMVAGVLVEVVLSFILFTPRPRFLLERDYFREILHSGKWVTLYGIFHYLAQEGDNIFVGRMLGAQSLGVYQMAYKISLLPISEVGDVVSRVIFPVYTRISDDRSRLRNAFIKSTIAITVPSVLLGVIIFLFPSFIVSTILGEKWSAAAPILQVLAVYGVLRAVSGPASALFLGVGKQQYVTAMLFVRFAVLFIALYPMIRQFGMIGAAYAAVLSVIFEIPVILYFIWKVMKKNSSEQ